MKNVLPPKHIVIVAGEESGDMHAATLIKQLKAEHVNYSFSGIGGEHMEKAGALLVANLARFGVTGVTEVLRHFSVIRRAYRDIQAHLTTTKPDLLILVDYPGFNLRLAKFAKKKLGIRIVYYISPQIWAWKAGRINTIRQYIDHMAVILPFEKALYQQAGVNVSFVGHPLVSDMLRPKQHALASEPFKVPPGKRLIALLPGSRTNEIHRHMPVLRETAKQLTQQFPNLHFIIPVAQTIEPTSIDHYMKDNALSYQLIDGNAVESADRCECIIVASGTASLECALLAKPMCIIYKTSLFTAMIAAKLIRVKYLGLCNLLQNKMIVPELIQYDCNPHQLTQVVAQFLTNPEFVARVESNLQQLKTSLSAEQADCTLAKLITNMLTF